MHPSLPLLHPTKPEVPVSAPDSHPFHPGRSQVLGQLCLHLLNPLWPWSLHPYSAISTLELECQALAPCPGTRTMDSISRVLPCLGSQQSLSALLLVWVSAGQDPFELEERSKPQIPSWPQHPWRGGAFLFSQRPGLLRVLGRGCSRCALMFLSAIPLSCFFKRCRFPYKLLPERSDKPLQVKLYLRCGPEGALKNTAHAISCIYLNYSGESRGRHWDGAGKRGLHCLIGVHI